MTTALRKQLEEASRRVTSKQRVSFSSTFRCDVAFCVTRIELSQTRQQYLQLIRLSSSCIAMKALRVTQPFAAADLVVHIDNFPWCES